MVAKSIARAAAAATGVGSTLLLLKKSEELPIAYHEAGHSIMAVHYATRGVAAATPTGWHSFRVLPQPLLRFATVVPRNAPSGLYVGETKLSVRWRHMADHVVWCREASGDPALLVALDFRDLDLAAASRADDAPSYGPDRQRVLLCARIAYLMGGRVAEDIRAGVCTGDSHACVRQLVSSPGAASGDLRQIRRLGGGEAAPSEQSELAMQAYAFSAQVLTSRWPQVQALAGALLTLGTLSGRQCEELLSCAQASPSPAEPTLLALARTHPLLFGCVWGAMRPAVERRESRRHPRADEPWQVKCPHDGHHAYSSFEVR